MLVCMAVAVVLGDGSLAGCHITGFSTEETLLKLLKEQINGRAIARVYMIGSPKEHFQYTKREHFQFTTNSDRRGVSDLTYNDKARIFGHNGQVFTVAIATGHAAGAPNGLHVRVVSHGPQELPSIEVAAEQPGGIRYSRSAGFTFSAGCEIWKLRPDGSKALPPSIPTGETNSGSYQFRKVDPSAICCFRH